CPLDLREANPILRRAVRVGPPVRSQSRRVHVQVTGLPPEHSDKSSNPAVTAPFVEGAVASPGERPPGWSERPIDSIAHPADKRLMSQRRPRQRTDETLFWW